MDTATVALGDRNWLAQVSPSAVKNELHQERIVVEKKCIEGSSPAAIPRLKSGALEIDHEQLADSG